MSTAHRQRVVIVGGGFGGLTAAKKLAAVPVDIALVDRNNFHTFSPLLYQVATSGLAADDIAPNLRGRHLPERGTARDARARLT